MDTTARALLRFSRSVGTPVEIRGGELLVERARLTGTTAPPAAGTTLRGSGVMLRHPQGWAAYNIARPADEEAVGALTAGQVIAVDHAAMERWAAVTSRDEALHTAALVDIPSAAVPEQVDARPASPFRLSALAQRARQRMSDIRVADFSSLWAGPLAAALLSEAGAQVQRFEAHDRRELPAPGDEAFSHRLNSSKELVLFERRDREHITAALADADVVIVSARPRALLSLGIVPRPGQVFVRITAHGAAGAGSDRVGFGDDCAAAAGAVGWVQQQPVFAADALADPATGLLAATAAIGLVRAGLAGVIDLNLRASARWLTASGQSS
ncbi:CoA transferase [Microbacterium sp. A93]|uniref:CoA transferase n=1 Tax=Microbacterium sp. A93 TaxID=3450716 RepID=UPI003F4387DA